jgi:hypothetical protein
MIAKGSAGYLYTICRNSSLSPGSVVIETETPPQTSEQMKYEKTINLIAGQVTPIVTTLTTEPYTIVIFDSNGIDISNDLGNPEIDLVDGIYVISIYSSDNLYNAKLKIIY